MDLNNIPEDVKQLVDFLMDRALYDDWDVSTEQMMTIAIMQDRAAREEVNEERISHT